MIGEECDNLLQRKMWTRSWTDGLRGPGCWCLEGAIHPTDFNFNFGDDLIQHELEVVITSRFLKFPKDVLLVMSSEFFDGGGFGVFVVGANLPVYSWPAQQREP